MESKIVVEHDPMRNIHGMLLEVTDEDLQRMDSNDLYDFTQAVRTIERIFQKPPPRALEPGLVRQLQACTD